MNSIDKNQPESNKKDLRGDEAAQRIKELATEAETCFFLSGIKTGARPDARPMAVLQVDEHGNFWFLSANDSRKNADITKDPNVELLMQGSKHAGFLSVYGQATISTDRKKIKELWHPLAKVWFTGGEEDPRITVIKVEPTKSHYWDNKHGEAIAFVKMVAGALTGQTLDDSEEGRLIV